LLSNTLTFIPLLELPPQIRLLMELRFAILYRWSLPSQQADKKWIILTLLVTISKLNILAVLVTYLLVIAICNTVLGKTADVCCCYWSFSYNPQR